MLGLTILFVFKLGLNILLQIVEASPMSPPLFCLVFRNLLNSCINWPDSDKTRLCIKDVLISRLRNVIMLEPESK